VHRRNRRLRRLPVRDDAWLLRHRPCAGVAVGSDHDRVKNHSEPLVQCWADAHPTPLSNHETSCASHSSMALPVAWGSPPPCRRAADGLTIVVGVGRLHTPRARSARRPRLHGKGPTVGWSATVASRPTCARAFRQRGQRPRPGDACWCVFAGIPEARRTGTGALAHVGLTLEEWECVMRVNARGHLPVRARDAAPLRGSHADRTRDRPPSLRGRAGRRHAERLGYSASKLGAALSKCGRRASGPPLGITPSTSIAPARACRYAYAPASDGAQRQLLSELPWHCGPFRWRIWQPELTCRLRSRTLVSHSNAVSSTGATLDSTRKQCSMR